MRRDRRARAIPPACRPARRVRDREAPACPGSARSRRSPTGRGPAPGGPRRGAGSSVRSPSARSSRAIAAGMSSRAAARRPAVSSRAAASSPSPRARSASRPRAAQRAAGLLQVVACQVVGGRRARGSARSLRASASCRSARCVFGIRAYAASRTRPCANAYRSSPAGPGAGRTRPARVRATSEEIACQAVLRPRQLDEGARLEPPADHGGAFEQRELWRGSWSRRAAITASIVGGMGSAPGAASAATAASCSRNSGFPSATAMISSRGASALPLRRAAPPRRSPRAARARSSRSPSARALVEELGPPEPDQRDRRLRHECGEVVDEVVEGRLGPVRVVHDEHDAAAPARSPRRTYGPPRRSRPW